MDEVFAWPSGIRDTTEFPTAQFSVDLQVDTRGHLADMISAEGNDWNAPLIQQDNGQAMTGSRSRSFRKLYERLGLITKEDETVKLTAFGKQIKNLEPALNEIKDEHIMEARRSAISILSRYQLRNPVDGATVPADCDVLPYVCIWKIMRALENKVCTEEINRVVLHIRHMEDIDAAIERIRTARAAYGNYRTADAAALDTTLGTPVFADQATARIAPWFSLAGWGGLIIKTSIDGDGFRCLVDDAIPLVDEAIANPPAYQEYEDEDSWRSYFTQAEQAQETTIQAAPIRFQTPYDSRWQRNRIIFGAPGTGKSFTLNRERRELLGADNDSDYERVTFHPDYSYASFVGTYKPVPHGDVITYEYVPGPFMRVYVNALKNGRTNNVKPFLLIIEEINRANVAAVFGDVFQLLDRDGDNVSEYPIEASEDIKSYLAAELGCAPSDVGKIRIPNNMFIWATMNSADQGVFPMDTAFKRRWDFTYIGIDDSEDGICGRTVVLGTGAYSRVVEWNEFRKAINDRLSSFKINEDKLLGPFFLSRKIVLQGGNIDGPKFMEAFKNKVLMYLFEDAAKQKRPSLFAEDVDTTKYSAVCKAFEDKGVFAFCTEISSRFNTMPDQHDQEGDT